MQTLYNCKRIDASHYRITKFDDGLVPFQHHDGSLSSYTCTKADCDCPQGHKPTCRHRKMLPLFIEQEHVDDNYFFIWDTHQWFKATGIFAEAAKANGRDNPEPTKHQLDAELIAAMSPEPSEIPMPTQELDVEALKDAMDYVGIPTVIIDEKEGGPLPASAAPSPQPSRYRRMR